MAKLTVDVQRTIAKVKDNQLSPVRQLTGAIQSLTRSDSQMSVGLSRSTGGDNTGGIAFRAR